MDSYKHGFLLEKEIGVIRGAEVCSLLAPADWATDRTYRTALALDRLTFVPQTLLTISSHKATT